MGETEAKAPSRLSNKAFEQTPRERRVLSIRTGRSSTPRRWPDGGQTDHCGRAAAQSDGEVVMKRLDLHIHTVPTLKDAQFDFSMSALERYVSEAKLDAIAITNHDMLDLDQFRRIQATGACQAD